jgi:hypothetical protein
VSFKSRKALPIRVAKLPVTLIFATVTSNVTLTLVTMTEIAEEQVYMYSPVLYLKCGMYI